MSIIGFFIGAPVPSLALARYNAFIDKIGHVPHTSSVFINYKDPIWSQGKNDLQWSVNSKWSANNFSALTELLRSQGEFTPIVTVGLTDDLTAFRLRLPPSDPAFGKYSEAAAVTMMNNVANRKYDDDNSYTGHHRVWPAIIDAFRVRGISKMYLRIGWEQNGNWYGWRVCSEATKKAYIAAWRHVAALAHRYANKYGMDIRTVWSPSASYANFGIPEVDSYPGDEFVDVIAPTAYSPLWNVTRSPQGGTYHDWSTQQGVTLETWMSNPENRRHIWDYPASDFWNPVRGWGIPAALAFARERGKPFGLAETGTGNRGITTQGGGPIDDGEYPIYLAERLTAARARGSQIEFVDIWAQASGPDRLSFISGNRPLEVNAWRHLCAALDPLTVHADI